MSTSDRSMQKEMSVVNSQYNSDIQLAVVLETVATDS